MVIITNIQYNSQKTHISIADLQTSILDPTILHPI
jgi:hypothetical protein